MYLSRLFKNHSGYRCFDPSSNKFFLSRHVIFLEDAFPLPILICLTQMKLYHHLLFLTHLINSFPSQIHKITHATFILSSIWVHLQVYLKILHVNLIQPLFQVLNLKLLQAPHNVAFHSQNLIYKVNPYNPLLLFLKLLHFKFVNITWEHCLWILSLNQKFFFMIFSLSPKLPFQLIRNEGLWIRLSNLLNGKKLCHSSLMLFLRMIHGILFPPSQVRILLVVNGFLESKGTLMVLSIATKQYLLRNALINDQAWMQWNI